MTQDKLEEVFVDILEGVCVDIWPSLTGRYKSYQVVFVDR